MANKFSVGQALAVGTARGRVGARGGNVPAATGSFIQGVGQGFAAQGPGISKALQQRQQYSTLSEQQKLEKAANPRDIADIEAFVAAYQSLTEERRATELAKMRKSVDILSVPLLEYHVKKVGEAPEKSFATEFGKGGPYEGQRDVVSKMLAGTTPGKEYQLGLERLAPGERAGELTKRATGLEGMFPGIGEAGALGIPAGETKVLSQRERVRERVRQAKQTGRTLADVQKVLKDMKSTMLMGERQEVLDEAIAQGILDEIGAAEAQAYIKDIGNPQWAQQIENRASREGKPLPPKFWTNLGMKKGPDGIMVYIEPKSVQEGVTQQNLRSVMTAPKDTNELIKMIRPGDLDMIRKVAYGTDELTDVERIGIGDIIESSTFTTNEINFIMNPTINMNPGDDDYWERVYTLIRMFGIEGAALAIRLGMDITQKQYLEAPVPATGTGGGGGGGIWGGR